MSILASKGSRKNPGYPRHNSPPFEKQFQEYAAQAGRICITTGYVSIDSILFLQRSIQEGRLPETDLTIGMYGLEPFTAAQYSVCRELAELLRDTGKGVVRICTGFKCHGKVYSFYNGGRIQAAIVGSSNLSSLTPDPKQMEIDITVEDESSLAEIRQIQEAVIDKTIPLLDWEPPYKFRTSGETLETLPGIEVLPADEAETSEEETSTCFEIPLPTSPKSSLNACFSKGRQGQPRPWYEAEVIVRKSITSQEGYPQHREFEVTTDDGYRFVCKTSGDHSKNLRSKGDLTILGRWIKGRMEDAGVLKPGEVITLDHLEAYGRTSITLSATRDPDKWLLDFSRPAH